MTIPPLDTKVELQSVDGHSLMGVVVDLLALLQSSVDHPLDAHNVVAVLAAHVKANVPLESTPMGGGRRWGDK